MYGSQQDLLPQNSHRSEKRVLEKSTKVMSRRRTLSTNYRNELSSIRKGSNSFSRTSQPKLKQSISELKDLMYDISIEWPQCMPKESNPGEQPIEPNPVEVAIGLLDRSRVGMSHKLPQFEEISERTANALRRVVTDHYEVFNNSIGSYHLLLNSSSENQNDAAEIKQMLESTTKEIHDKSDILQDLNQTSMRYSEMIEILEAMEVVNSIPDKIEQLILDKKIHQVYDIIAQGYATADKYNLWNLSAMASIKSYLDLQSNNLFDMIIDELQNEVYLKGPETLNEQNTWDLLVTSNNNPKLSSFKTFIDKLNTLDQYIYNSANLDIPEISDCLNELLHDFVKSELPKIFGSQSSNLHLTFDLSGSYRNYHYIYQLLVTASKLNRLSQVVEILNQSNQQELHGLFYRTIEETKLKNLHEINKLNKLVDFESEFDNELMNFNDYSVKILKDLFSTVFVRSLIVLQKQKLIEEIALKFELRYDFKNNWNVLKNELTNLITSYISAEPTGYNNKAISNMNDLYKLDNITLDNKELGFKFPNLIEKDGDSEYGMYQDSFYIKSESFQSNLQTLVPVNIFNMRIINEFFVLFVSSATGLMSSDKTKLINKTCVDFFESFMKVSFLPKLRDNFDSKFNQIMGNTEASFEDGNNTEIRGNFFRVESMTFNDSMIYQNAFEFKKFFISLCYIFNTSLTYRNELSDLVLLFLDKFESRYSVFFNTLLGNSTSTLSNWLKTPALKDISSVIIEEDGVINAELLNKEVDIMLFNDNALDINNNDLLDDETLNQLCYLLLTSGWILSWLPHLGKESNYNYEGDLNLIEKLRHDWSFLENGKKVTNDEGTADSSNNGALENLNIYLSLNSKKFKQFEDIIQHFQNIRLNSLIILRYELRLKSIYYVTKSYKLTEWVLANEPGDADQFISKLNKEMFSLENKLNHHLSDEELSKIFIGMSNFLNELLIKASKLIYKINNNGVKRLLINIFTLLQMLKNLNKNNLEIDFKKSSYYFNLFTVNENQIPSKTANFTKEERLNLARMLYSEKLADGNGSSFNVSKYNDLISKLT